MHATLECPIPSPVICWRCNSKIVRFRRFFGADGGVIRLLGTPLRENCRAPLAGMASSKSEGKAEALGISFASNYLICLYLANGWLVFCSRLRRGRGEHYSRPFPNDAIFCAKKRLRRPPQNALILTQKRLRREKSETASPAHPKRPYF